MKKLVIIRFGSSAPMPQVSAALKRHITDPQTAIAMPVPGGVVSIFDTESSESEVAEDVKAAGALFFIFPFNRAAMHLPAEVMQGIDRLYGTSAPTPVATRPAPLTIDQVLEKIADSGMESLTPEEIAILEGRA
jgi:hypothetical protein